MTYTIEYWADIDATVVRDGDEIVATGTEEDCMAMLRILLEECQCHPGRTS